MMNHVFVNHSPQSPPPHPGSSYTRFVCISDTHSRLFPVPPGDVLLHAGDLSSWGDISQLRKTINWLKSLPHPTKIIIAGNHDLCLDQSWKHAFDTAEAQALVRDDSAREAGIFYLEHEALQFTTAQGRTWRVYGSPAAPLYAQGAFQYTTSKEARDIYSRIPSNTDILLTHTPPYHTHDVTRKGKHAGCRVLAARLQELEEGSAVALGSNPQPGLGQDNSTAVVSKAASTPWKCKLHVWGHIHEAYGATIKRESSLETVQVNAALASNEKPIIVDLHNGF